jgi:hypothetical protein
MHERPDRTYKTVVSHRRPVDEVEHVDAVADRLGVSRSAVLDDIWDAGYAQLPEVDDGGA